MSDKDKYAEEPLEPVYPIENLIGVGGLARGVAAALKNVAGRRVKNVVVRESPGEGNLLSGRLPKADSDVTHAYRNMSKAEAEDASVFGAFRKNPNPGKGTWDANKKWWSSGDDLGKFGREWKGAGTEAVRVPIGKVKPGWAVKTKNAEKYNKETDEWVPFKAGGAVRGNGIATKHKKTKYF